MKNHELFPGNDTNPNPEVVKICVTRVENGVPKAWPFGFVPAEELPDVASLYARCGGGRYELVSRDDKKITSRTTLTLDGEPKPLDGSTRPAAPAHASAPVAAPEGSPQWLTVVAALAPLAMGFFEMSAKRAENQANLMVSMMQGKAAETNAHIQNMQAMYAAQSQQMATLFQAMRPPEAGANGVKLFEKGVEMAFGLVNGVRDGQADAAGGSDSIASTATQVLAALKEGKALLESGGPPPGMSPPPGAPREVARRRVVAAPDPEPNDDDDDEPEAAETDTSVFDEVADS